MAKQYDLYLRNYVGGYDFDSDYVVYFLNKNKDKDITVLIDSRGGSLATGISISSAFRDHGNVEAHFTSLNASAATIASLGAKKITMASDAFYLVHKASVPIFEWTSMNADQIEERCRQLEKTRAELAKFDVVIARAYAKRCKKKHEDMLALMQKETWLSADEALAWGFIDEITDYEDDPKTEITPEVLADFTALGVSIPEKLASKTHKDKFFDRILNIFNSFSMDKNTNQTADGTQDPAKDKPDTTPANNDQGKDKEKNPEMEAILERLDKIEQKIAGKDEQPEEKPGDDALQVINNRKTDPPQSSYKSAADLFNMLP